MGERGRCDVDVLRALGPAVGCPGRRAAADHGGDDERLTLLPGASSVASLIEVSVIGGHYHQPLLRGPGRTVAQRRQQTSEPLVLSERSEEHTSELQSRGHLVCRLLLEKKNHEHGGLR